MEKRETSTTPEATDDDLALRIKAGEYGSGIADTVAQCYPEIDPFTGRMIAEGGYLDGLRAARRSVSATPDAPMLTEEQMVDAIRGAMFNFLGDQGVDDEYAAFIAKAIIEYPRPSSARTEQGVVPTNQAESIAPDNPYYPDAK